MWASISLWTACMSLFVPPADSLVLVGRCHGQAAMEDGSWWQALSGCRSSEERSPKPAPAWPFHVQCAGQFHVSQVFENLSAPGQLSCLLNFGQSSSAAGGLRLELNYAFFPRKGWMLDRSTFPEARPCKMPLFQAGIDVRQILRKQKSHRQSTKPHPSCKLKEVPSMENSQRCAS